MKIRSIEYEDIPMVVNIHKEAIGYSLNARLGSRHLSHIYACVLNSDSAIVNVIEVDGIMVGVVSATTNPDKLSAEIKKSLSFKQKLLLAVSFVIRPWLIYNLWEHFRLSPTVVYKNILINACLTAIAVKPQYRGKGLGKALIDSVEDYFRSQDVKCYRLDTFKTNIKARSFYNQLGLIEAKEIGRNIILLKEIK